MACIIHATFNINSICSSQPCDIIQSFGYTKRVMCQSPHWMMRVLHDLICERNRGILINEHQYKVMLELQNIKWNSMLIKRWIKYSKLVFFNFNLTKILMFLKTILFTKVALDKLPDLNCIFSLMFLICVWPSVTVIYFYRKKIKS